jgi:oligosaccharide repeat unit polymerase
MYKYLVLFVLLSPLVGIYLVENGETAASIGIPGYANGASLAYGLYAALVATIAWAIGSGAGAGRPGLFPIPGSDRRFRQFAINLLLFDGAFLLLFLFGFGAINVLMGSVGKGAFRSDLGSFGALPNLMTKLIIPALLAYAALLYKRSSQSRSQKILLYANIAVVFVTGASWGFKSTAFIVLMPAIVLIFWDIRLITLAILGMTFGLLLIGFFFLFDAETEGAANVATFLFRRITVLQGDVAWYIWGQYVDGVTFPNYWPTLTAAGTDGLLTIFGLSKENFFEWMAHHYDYMLTYLAGSPIDQIRDGHSVTATPFAEGLIAGGIPGVAFFTVVAGALVGGMYRFIARSLRRGDDGRAAIGATYFCFYIFGWLNGGAIVQLFHLSLLIGLGATILTLQLLRRMRGNATPNLQAI